MWLTMVRMCVDTITVLLQPIGTTGTARALNSARDRSRYNMSNLMTKRDPTWPATNIYKPPRTLPSVESMLEAGSHGP